MPVNALLKLLPASTLIVLALAACSTADRVGDVQVRPTDLPECLVGSNRRDIAEGIRPLIGGVGCRVDPDNPRPLNFNKRSN